MNMVFISKILFAKMAFVMVVFIIFESYSYVYSQDKFPIKIAVEFTNHAACAYISLDKGWMKNESLEPTIYRYVTGMSLAAALGRGDIQAAYLCLLPAINAYANAKVPLKIVSGTHRYGYGLVVNPQIVKNVGDLEKPGVRIGCVRAGGPADAMLMKTIDKYGLDSNSILNKVQRMNPARQMMSIKMRHLEASFSPEHWPVIAEKLGFEMLLTSQDVWPGMQGSVLVVKQELIENHPEIVRRLVRVTCKATKWIQENPSAASQAMLRQLHVNSNELSPSEIVRESLEMEITPEMMLKSMRRMEYSVTIDPRIVQEMIDYAEKQGNIRHGFDAKDILDLRFLNEKKG